LKNNPHSLWAKIFFCVEDDNKTFVVEEFFSGENLSERKNFLTEIEARNFILQLCDGLKILHGAGIVHRDIKPSNLIVQDDKIKLIDFDAARIFSADKSEDTNFLGTKGYAPPEQFGYGQTDSRSDIFSLGVTFKKLLGKNCKGNLKKILSKCTELDPKNRYQTVDELKTALLLKEPKKNYTPAIIFVFIVITVIFSTTSETHEPPKEITEDKISTPKKIENQVQQKKSDKKIVEKKFEFPEIKIPETSQENINTEKNYPIKMPAPIPQNSGKIETDIYLNEKIFNQHLEGDIKILPEELPNQKVNLHIKNDSAVNWQNPKLKISFRSNFGKRFEEIKNLQSINVGESADISIPLNFYDIAKDAWQTWLQVWLIGNETLLTEKYWCIKFVFR